jgi:hypothetical protein
MAGLEPAEATADGVDAVEVVAVDDSVAWAGVRDAAASVTAGGDDPAE